MKLMQMQLVKSMTNNTATAQRMKVTPRVWRNICGDMRQDQHKHEHHHLLKHNHSSAFAF
jgi:hypothetical protein